MIESVTRMATVVSADHRATQAGLDLLSRGANAVEAAIAANAVMGVVAPQTCGVGGDLWALIYQPGTAEPLALMGVGRAGSAADPKPLCQFADQNQRAMHSQTVTVPGVVYGWEALLEKLGSGLPNSAVMAPAIELAREGFPASEELAHALSIRQERLSAHPSAAGLYPDGQVPVPGQTVRRPGLANTLDQIAQEGSDGFYQGQPGQNIVQVLGGVISMTDLTQNQAEWVNPWSIKLNGYVGWTVPPPSQGYLTLGTLGIFGQLGAPDTGTARGSHLLIESYRSLAASRDHLLSDPDFAPVSQDVLLGSELLEKLSDQIDSERVSPWLPPSAGAGGTTHLCVADGNGMGVTLTQSNFWGMGTNFGAGDSGFFLHNRGAGFSLEPGHPNLLAPGKRPLHTLSPCLWTREAELVLLAGTRGGHVQPQILAQVLSKVLLEQQPLTEAQAAWRWALPPPWDEYPPRLSVEDTILPEIAGGLEQIGWKLQKLPSPQTGWGPVALIGYGAGSDRIPEGVADPRGPDGLAASLTH